MISYSLILFSFLLWHFLGFTFYHGKRGRKNNVLNLVQYKHSQLNLALKKDVKHL